MARKFVSGLPAALSSMRAELEANFRAALQGAAGHFDLATRSEFDVQSQGAGALARAHRRSSRPVSLCLKNGWRNCSAVFLNGCAERAVPRICDIWRFMARPLLYHQRINPDKRNFRLR